MTNIVSLDKIDRKILYNLDLNSRISSTKLGKKLRLSREVVDYRIKNLIKKDIINRFYTHIDSSKLGYSAYKVYFKIKGLQSIQEKELKEYFFNYDAVYWIATCDGMYDMIIAIWARDVYELNEILRKCYYKYDSNFISKGITITTGAYLYRKEYLIGNRKSEMDHLFYAGERENIQLDDIDIEILKILANNARTPIIKIAKKTGITSGAVLYRLRELKNKKIIEGFRCSIDLEKIGYIFCKAFLSLSFTDYKKLKELRQFCAQHPNITLYLDCIGSWDFEIEFEIESVAKFHDLLKEIKNRFSIIIKECESVIISREYKFDYYPGAYKPKL